MTKLLYLCARKNETSNEPDGVKMPFMAKSRKNGA